MVFGEFSLGANVDNLVKVGELCYGCRRWSSRGNAFFCVHQPSLRDIMNKPTVDAPIRLTQLAHGGG
jgi:hypothetical protein